MSSEMKNESKCPSGFSCNGLTDKYINSADEQGTVFGTSLSQNPLDISPLLPCSTGDVAASWANPSMTEKPTVTRAMPKGHSGSLKNKTSSKREKCRAAGSLATQWLALLAQQNPPNTCTLKVRREPGRQSQEEQKEKRDVRPDSVQGCLPSKVSFAEVVRRGVVSSSLPLDFSAVSSTEVVSDDGARRDVDNKGLSRTSPTSRTFTLVPEKEEDLPQLFSLLRKISLTGASLETVVPREDGAAPDGVGSLASAVDGNRSAATVDGTIGKNTTTTSRCYEALSLSGARTRWEEIRVHLGTLYHLVRNREEMGLVLDSLLGSGWCLDGESSLKRTGLSSDDEMSLPPSKAMVSGTASPQGLFLVKGSGAREEEHQERQSEAGVSVASSTLNYNAAPFESSLHPVLVSPSPGAPLKNFLDESSETPAVGAPARSSPFCPAVQPTTTKIMTEPEGGATVPSTSTEAPNNTTPPNLSSASVPSVAFKLESREEMIRRRTAVAAAMAKQYAYATSGGHHGGRSHGSWSGQVSPLLSFMNPASKHPSCPFDYLLVLDFEATCEEIAPPSYLHEIIEFPVVVVDVRLQRTVAEFHRYVKPKVNPQLSEFCRRLTGIRQEDIDNAMPLESVIRQFERWCAQTIPPGSRVVLVTDGSTDLREFMYVHSVLRQGIRFPSMFYLWIDVKRAFAHFFQCQEGKIKAMLDVLHCPFEGRLHSGIDDARNIATIVIRMLQLGCSFCEIPLSRLPYGAATSTPSPSAPATAARAQALENGLDGDSSPAS